VSVFTAGFRLLLRWKLRRDSPRKTGLKRGVIVWGKAGEKCRAKLPESVWEIGVNCRQSGGALSYTARKFWCGRPI